MYICLFRCEGKFILIRSLKCLAHSGCTMLVCWMSNEHCENNEWRTIRELYLMSNKNRSNTQWRRKFPGAADSHRDGEDWLPWERVSPSTAHSPSSDTEALARRYLSSPWNLQRTEPLFFWGYYTESHQLLPLVLKTFLDPSFLIHSVTASASLCVQGRQ